MTKQEKEFYDNLKAKIKKYNIKKDGKLLTVKQCLPYARNKFVMSEYKDGSPQELIDIGIETFLYKLSPYLFIEKYGTFDLPGAGTLSAKNLYYFQKEILKDFTNWKKIVLTKTRQCGLSTLSSLIFFWKSVMFKKEWLLIISKDSKTAQDFLEKIRLNLSNLPSWLGISKKVDNVKTIKFSNGSRIEALARSKGAGRGSSPTMVILDEAAFYSTNTICEGIVASVMPSLSRTGGTLIVVSTPNGSAEGSEGYWYYKQVSQLEEAGGIDGPARLYDVKWWEVLDFPGIEPYKGFNEKVQTYIDRDYFNNPDVKKEANNFFMPYAKNNWQENDWLSFQLKNAGKIKYLQEVLQNFIVTGSAVFEEDVIDRIQKDIKEPISKDKLKDKKLEGFWMWKACEPNRKYIMGVDIAKGSSNDSTSVEVYDADTMEQVGEYAGKITTYEAGKIANKIGEYYNYAYCVVECNSIGEAVFNELYYHYNYPSLYKRFVNKDGKDIVTGWMTTNKSRDLITNNFIEHCEDEDLYKEIGIRSERLLSQMKHWIWKGNRPDHASGCHDDNILASAIALYNVAIARKNMVTDDAIVFLDNNGNSVKAIQEGFNTLAEKAAAALEGKKENIAEIESAYREKEREMYQNAGLDPDNSESSDIYKWLLS